MLISLILVVGVICRLVVLIRWDVDCTTVWSLDQEQQIIFRFWRICFCWRLAVFTILWSTHVVDQAFVKSFIYFYQILLCNISKVFELFFILKVFTHFLYLIQAVIKLFLFLFLLQSNVLLVLQLLLDLSKLIIQLLGLLFQFQLFLDQLLLLYMVCLFNFQ